MKKHNILMSTTAVLMLSSLAHGQTTDYGSLEELFGEPVTEGATGTPKRGSDAPINMTIVTAEEIERSGARDIPEILRRVAGVDVQRIGQMGASVSFRGRNTDNQRLRVLINGRDTFRAHEGTTAWSAIPVSMEEIRQIEVVRGPATALYGANAATGVINIITFNPMYDSKNKFSASIGDNGLREVSGVSTIPLGDVGGIRLSGGYVEIDRTDVFLSPDQLLTRPAEPKNRRIAGDGLFNVTDSLKVGFEGTYIKSSLLLQNISGLDDSGESEDYSLRMYASLDSGFGRWTLQAFQNTIEESRATVFDPGTGPAVLNQVINAETQIC
jgi:iron complex outermembrane receptor protein